MTHYNLVNTAYMDVYNANMIDESSVICVPIPIFHSFGLITGVIEPLICGGKAVFPHLLPDTLAMLKAIQSEKCTSIKGSNKPNSMSYVEIIF